MPLFKDNNGGFLELSAGVTPPAGFVPATQAEYDAQLDSLNEVSPDGVLKLSGFTFNGQNISATDTDQERVSILEQRFNALGAGASPAWLQLSNGSSIQLTSGNINAFLTDWYTFRDQFNSPDANTASKIAAMADVLRTEILNVRALTADETTALTEVETTYAYTATLDLSQDQPAGSGIYNVSGLPQPSPVGAVIDWYLANTSLYDVSGGTISLI